MTYTILCCLFTISCLSVKAFGQSGNRYYPNVRPIRVPKSSREWPGVREFKTVCNAYSDFRSYNGFCTNPENPLLGRARRPFHSYFEGHNARIMGGKNLLSARQISNTVLHQFQIDIKDEVTPLREFITFFGQFLDHNIVQTSNDMKKASSIKNIPVPRSDPRCEFNTLHFNRVVKAKVGGNQSSTKVKMAMNVLSSAVDLYGVYGSKSLSRDLRDRSGGIMRTSDDGKNLLPLNDERINDKDSSKNVPRLDSREKRKLYFIAGDVRSNENPQLTFFHTLFLRHHNFLAEELSKIFKGRNYNNDWLFEAARRVNQAHFQAIVFTEFLPNMTGETLKDCSRTSDGDQCFDPEESVAISDIFAVAAFRVGHTMVGDKIHRSDKDGNSIGDLNLKDAFFQEASRLAVDGMEPYLRGMLNHPAQKIDNHISDALRNLLFVNLESEEGFDLASLNIQRGRDNNLPTFAAVKKKFLGKLVTQFSDITSDRNLQGQLEEAYQDASRVEAYVGLICEDHTPGKPMGPTMAAIWMEEFRRLRHGDFYFYKNRNILPPELKSFPYMNDIIEGKGETMRDLIIRHTDLVNSEVPQNVWRMS